MSATPLKCPHCTGLGLIRTTIVCLTCEGSGWLERKNYGQEPSTPVFVEKYKCSKCSGMGSYIEEKWCATCAKTGQVVAEAGKVTCPTCKGNLTIPTTEQYPSGLYKHRQCPTCTGKGWITGTVYRPDFT
jgi:DnaJ-class molecular chaperone